MQQRWRKYLHVKDVGGFWAVIGMPRNERLGEPAAPISRRTMPSSVVKPRPKGDCVLALYSANARHGVLYLVISTVLGVKNGTSRRRFS